VSPTRYGDPEPEPGSVDEPVEHDPRCRKGWIDRDSDQPIPCLVCKPHLAPRNRVRQVGE
jgi:hypothetical protein